MGLSLDTKRIDTWQDPNPVDFIRECKDLIYHVDCKDVKLNLGNGVAPTAAFSTR